MTISRAEFDKQCVEFVKRCHQLEDPWQLVGEKSGLILDCDKKDEILAENLMLTKKEIKKIEDALINCEYSIIFSESFDVPVFYFCISDQCGNPVDITKFSCYKFPLDTVNQVEHPHFSRPFNIVHPCKTSNFMKFRQDREDYLLCWLSTVATLIGFRLNPKLAIHNQI